MKMLRINLRIRDDVSPRLYEALASLPPHPRAELLRKLAERGLQPVELPHSESGRDGVPIDPGTQDDSQLSDRAAFGDELVRVVGGIPRES
jgi:hypothetical protein